MPDHQGKGAGQQGRTEFGGEDMMGTIARALMCGASLLATSGAWAQATIAPPDASNAAVTATADQPDTVAVPVPQAGETETNSRAQLEDVVVTARKRTESLL